MTAAARFAFVQLEFGFLLGPADGRYLIRSEPGGEPERIVVLGTLGAPQRRLMGGRRAKAVESAEPEPVPTSRATTIAPAAFAGEDEAAAWLDALRRDADALAAECAAGAHALNVVLRAHRAAAADPYARDVAVEHALVARAGYGSGEQVAHGRFAAALELPRAPRKASRGDRIGPQERLAAVLGGRASQLACEELVLRARADVEADRPREAALEARIALEALAAELRDSPAATALDEVEERRAQVAEAASAALSGDPPAELQDAVAAAVTAMELVLRRHRSGAAAG